MVEAWIAGVALGYLLGSVPTGLWVGRYIHGVDVRAAGSGKTGATNTLRRFGVRWSVVVFAVDTGKAALAVAVIRLAWDSPTGEVLAGVAAVVGHIFPLFAGFRGGRGATTGFGAMLVLVPLVALLGLVVGALLLTATRIMSLSVLTGATVVAVAMIALAAMGEEPDALYGFAIPAWVIIVAAHHDNIGRLRAGTEPRLGQTGVTQPTPEDRVAPGAGGSA